MNKPNVIFHYGFLCSSALLLIAAITGGDDAARMLDARELGFSYVATSPVVRWVAILYVALNIPAVVASAIIVAAIVRIVDLSPAAALVAWLPLCASASAYWWRWLGERWR